MNVTDTSRHDLLERYARWYGEERLAIAFTATTQGENAKKVTTAGWETTRPLAGADYAAGLIPERARNRNVAIVLRPSNLVVLECDSEEDLVRIEQLQLPQTITVRSSKPYKRHFYFRPPPELERLPYVAFRFESGKLTADAGRYFLAPPSIHPSGAIYAFLPERGPGDVDIAELPEHIYRQLADSARQEDAEQTERIEFDPDFKVRAGQRGDSVFRMCCQMRRWGWTRDEILQAALRWNDRMCDPPIERARVEIQVEGAMRKRGNQELERARDNPLPEHDEEDWHTHDVPAGNWRRRDLTRPELLVPPDPPAIQGLLYAAKRHVLSGPQESAKTLIAYHLLLQAHRDGHPVAIVDFEMGEHAATRLLVDLGATPSELANLYYTEPDGPPTPDDITSLTTHGTRYALIDAAAGAFDATGLDDNSRKDAETFARLWIRPLWQRGIATLLLDHVTKDRESRGKYAIGSERKTGAADIHLGFDALKALSRGGNGLVKATVHKDRPGFLARPTAAMLDLTSAPDTHAITVQIRDPHPTDDHGDFRPTIYMERVSRALEKNDGPMSRNEIEEAVKGKRDYVRDALDWLLKDGHTTEIDGPRRARIVTLLKPYLKPQDDLAPTSPPPRPGEVVVSSPDFAPPRPPLTGGEGEDGGHDDAKNDNDLAPNEINVYDPNLQSLLDDDIPF